MTNFNFLLNNLSYLSSEDLVGRPMDSTCFRSAPVPPSFRLRLHPLRMVATLLLLLCLGVGEVWGATETSTFTSKNLAVGDGEPAWTGSTGSNSDDSEFGVSGRGVQYFAANGTTKTFTSTAFRNKLIKSVSAVVSRNKANYPVSISVTVNSNTLGSGDTSGDQPNNETITTSDDVGIACSTGDVVVSISTGGPSSSAKSLYVKSISVTYSDGCVSTLTTPVVTATPTSGQVVLTWPDVANATKYQLKWDGGSWTDAVSGVTKTSLTNGTEYTYQVKAIGNGSTICDSDPTESAKVIPGTYYTVTWMLNGSTYETTSVRSGTKPTFPDNPTSCDLTSTTFMGWTQTGWSGKIDDISKKTTDATKIYAKASDMPDVSGAVTYYAVFAKKDGGEPTSVTSYSAGNYYLVAKYSTSYYAMSGSTTSGITAVNVTSAVTYNSTPKTITVDPSSFTADMVYAISGTTSAATITQAGTVVGNNTSGDFNRTGTWAISDISSAKTFRFSGNSRCIMYRNTPIFKNYATSNAGGAGYGDGYLYLVPAPTYSKYLTNCCTQLGTINGSVSWSNAATAVVSWDNLDHVSSWTVKYKTHAAGAYTTWAGDQSTAAGRRSVTITGLTPCTNYDFQIIANPASGYCDKDQTIEDSQTHNWTVTSTGVTHATASPAIPSTTCSGFSTTISPATGYALPAEIAVTNASKSWNSSTGALSISSVTGNVSITITPTCVSPNITADPADADYYVDDDPTPLSVTATLASGTRTYLWKVSTNGGSTWSDATGTNNTATYSGASLSTAYAGTLKFKCIVGNSEGGCTVESEVATITVAEPSSWKFKYSGDEWIEHTMIEDAGEVSYSISLAADSRFEFGFDGGSFYKNNGTIITTTSGWVFNTTDNNCHIHTGPAGIYTFTINTTTKAVTVTYPTVSHPNEHYVYFKNTNVWGTVYGYLANSGNDNKAAAWPGSVMQPTTSICGETYHYAALNAMSGTYNTIIFNNGSEGYGNQTSDLSTTGSLGKYNANQDDSWHQFKYAINFDKGTGSGDAMVSIENLCPGSNQALTANTYTKEHNTFAGWIADVDVKVGESTIDAGEIIDDEVTIKDIQSDINLTAQWTPDTYTITKTLTNVANTGLPTSFTYTGATTTALNSTFTVDATNFFLPSSIAVTMGGTPLTAGTDYTYNNSTGAFTFSAVITGDIDITATATAKLKSIAITTLPTTRKYFAGESFSSTGAVVTATMGDGSTKPVSVTWDLTTLTAGAGQTVTASYSEGGIDQTATTTIDVYSVTVNKVNEDGDAISADGVTATWTVGSKALAAGVGSTKYAFKQWEVTGASIGSTTSASTTLSSPTANVVVNAIFYKPRVVKWSVNGDDSYATGGPTTEVAYNGTISTVPTDPSGLACASTFVAWTDATHNNGQTAKDDDSYYGSALYTAAGDFPNITAETTTFYAVFAERDGAAENTVMWSENWTGVTSGNKPSQYDGTGRTVYNGGSVTYTESGSDCNVKAEYYAGGSSPELYIKGGEWWNIANIPTGGATTLTLTYMSNKDADVTTTTGKVAVGTTSSSSNTRTRTITISGDVSYFDLKFAKSSNTRVDNILLKVASVTLTNYVTECDANIVAVTYNANGGSTSCTNTTTDKTEDFTVCSTPPTRDYYTFAGWLCSADSKTYAANATIDDAVIDADFTLTAQWTPIDYDITYNLYGGTNSGSNPATYNVETATITLQNPTKGHDRFDGWYSTYSAGVYSDQVTSIPLGSHGNVTLYAKWAERHEIIFDADGATTTIYRADDEDLSASVAGQGSVPSDPSAPTACSTKVFVGWSESTIDDETDDEPGDLMKPAAGTVNEDKHYYAVWANESSTTGPVTVFEDALYGKADNNTTFDEYGDWHDIGYVYGCGTSTEGVRVSSADNAGFLQLKANIGLASVDTIKFKIKSYGDSNGGKITLSSYSGAGTYDNGSSAVFTTTNTSSWEEKTCILRSADNTTDISFEGSSGKYRVYLKDIKITKAGTVYTYSAYSTSCCATKVTLSENSPEHGTIAFGKSIVGTCGGDKEVSLTITPAAGYQLSSYEVATGSGKVAAKSVSPAIALNNNSSAAQNITLTFAEDANGAYDVTASFTEMVASAWTWTQHVGGATITTDPVEVYVGQKVQVDVSYEPAGLLSNHTNNSAYDYPKPWSNPNVGSPAKAGDHFTVTGTNAGSTSITLTHNDGLTKTIYYTVVARPLVHFVDKIHDETFADVVATVSGDGWTVTTTLPTPTHSAVDDPGASYNNCEQQHLHLIGWIESEWADAHPNAEPGDITGAGAGKYYAAGANIDLVAQNGKTFYAVWAKFE